MSIWQKLADRVASAGESLLGYFSGRGREGVSPDQSVDFTIAVIALGAKMAKADGVVSASEVDAFKEVFQVDKGELANVAHVFNMAKKDVAGFEIYARQIASRFGDKPEVLEDVLDSLFHIAKADGVVHEAELVYLREVTDIFGLSEKFRCIRARHLHTAEDDPYLVLGIDPCVTDGELRRLYREIVKENHPDRHIAAGMPPEMIAVANERLAAINSAYEAVARERGL